MSGCAFYLACGGRPEDPQHHRSLLTGERESLAIHEYDPAPDSVPAGLRETLERLLTELENTQPVHFKQAVGKMTKEAIEEPRYHGSDCIYRGEATVPLRAILAALPPVAMGLSVDRLARAFVKVRGAHNASWESEEAGEPCTWCRLAAEQAVAAIAALAAEATDDR